MLLDALHPARLTRAVRTGLALPGRVVGLVAEAEDLLAQARSSLAAVDTTISRAGASVARVERILDSTEATVARTDGLLNATEATVARTDGLLDSTEAITGQARTLIGRADELLASVEPMMAKVLPLLEKFASTLSPDEVDAAIKLVDELPVLAESLRTDVLPILNTLDHVGPDINELLHVMDDVRRAIVGIPGFSFLRKRGTELIEDDESPLELHPHDDEVQRGALPRGQAAAQ